MDWFLYDNGLRHERVKTNVLNKMQGIFVEKGTNKESIREGPSMNLDYKTKTIFVILVFQAVIHFINNLLPG